jgi:hypothetical protein
MNERGAEVLVEAAADGAPRGWGQPRSRERERLKTPVGRRPLGPELVR